MPPRGRVKRPRRAALWSAALWSAALLAGGAPLLAQQPELSAEASVGSEAEEYLRVLQVAGAAPLYPWSIRGFSPREAALLLPDSAHPWAPRAAEGPARAPWVRLLRPAVDLTYNSAFPHGANDGVTWAGRGITAAVRAGFALRAGPVSLRVEPHGFWAQNAGFELMPTGRTGRLAFADPDAPTTLDRPQRFGDQPYARIDPGESTLRVDVVGMAAGVSTASQQWGPSSAYPLVLGGNAGGFAHGFAGTSTPWKVGIGRVHGRVVWGSLAQSAWSPHEGHGSRRLMTGMVATFLPYGLDGLEVGASRFFHEPWPLGGLSPRDLAKPFEAIFKAGLGRTGEGPDARSDAGNQLASVFARWVLPGGGVEVWGEYLREDHSWDLLDFVLEPDHSAGYALGARKAWRRGESLLSLRAEWLNTQPGHLRSVRIQGPAYVHFAQLQGHTHRGQFLGSPAAYGGGGATLALEGYTPRGRWKVDLGRERVRGGRPGPGAAEVDVLNSAGAELLLFRRGFDTVSGVRGTWELNRHLGGDAFNLSASLGVRMGL